MVKALSPHVLEQAIADNLLIVSVEDSLRDVVRLINQGHNQDPVLSERINKRAELTRSSVSCVLVVAESKLVGILTQSDLIRLMLMESDISKIKVAEVMTQPVVTMKRSEFYDVDIPLKLLRQHRFSHLPLLNEHGYPIGLVTLTELLNVIDYTLQQDQIQQIESELLLTTITNRIQSSLDLQVILEATVQEVRQFLKTDRVIVYRFEPNWSGVVVAESATSYCASLLGMVITDPYFGEAMVEPYKNGRIQVTDDIYVGLTDCHTKFLEQIQVKAVVVVPILQGDQLWGLLAVQECLQPRFWDRASVALLQQLSTHISIAIQQASTMLQLQQINQRLENRIEERTTALTNSEKHLNLIVSNISDGILIVDREGRIVFANPSASRTFGMSIDQLIGLSIGVPNVLNNQFEITHLSHDGKIGESEMHVVVIEWDQQPAYLISLHDVTERIQAETKLLKIQTNLEEAQQIAHVGSWELDATTQTIHWSDEMFRLFRLPPNREEPSYDQLKQYIDPHDWDTMNFLINRAVQFGEPYEVDLKIIRADGSTGYIFAKGNPKRSIEGEILYLFGVALDISDRKANEYTLRRYERVVAATTDAIVLCDHNYRFQLVNQVYLDWHNQRLEDVIGHTLEEFKGERFRSIMQPKLDLSLAGEVQHYEDWFDYRDGSRRFVRITYSPYIEIDGSISGVLGSLHDLTELKQIEEDLRKSEERLSRYFNQPMLGMAISSTDRIWQDVNECLCNMLGYSHDELIQINWAEITHPDDIEVNLINFNKALAGESEGYVMDKRFIRKNGSIIHTIISAQCFRNPDGSVNYFVTMVQDISDRKQAELQLHLTNEELVRATRLKDEFLANMSHELRTPLNAILGMAEALQEQTFGKINEKQLKALRTVESGGEHLLALINDILDVAKIESGLLELDCAPTNIASLCQSSLAFIKQQALKKRIQLEIKLPEDLPDQILDERRIRQVLINLLNNAMKFTLEGGQITLEVNKLEDQEVESTNSWIRFSITDTGIGIAPENINKLFQPFIQIDSALNRKYDGTGLGLALVKQMVELHGGKVGLTSELGVGSCFTIDLPYLPSKPKMSEGLSTNTTTESESLSSHVATRSPLILMVEDNEANIITVSDYLEVKGYRLLLSKNGQEAIALTKAYHPDLILMDIQMPVMDGLEAIKQIRLDPDLVNIPIVAMTALAMTGDREKCLEAGANDYLSKPIKLKQLTTIIQQILNP